MGPEITEGTAANDANRVAQALLGAGLEPGDRVLLYCENSVEALLAMIGIANADEVCTGVFTAPAGLDIQLYGFDQ